MDATPDALLEAALATDPGRPLITFYDDRSGERVELSVATTANWVAKTAGLLVDGLGIAPGDRVVVDLPGHWLGLVWALSCWRTGCELVLPSDGDPKGIPDGPAPVVAVALPAGLQRAAASADEVIGVSGLPMAAPFRPGTLPAGALDYATAVPVHADRFTGPRPAPGSPALRTATGAWTLQQIVALARALAARWQAGDAARLLVAGPLGQPDELLASTVVPLLVGGSVVLCRPVGAADPAALDRRAAAERVTVRVG